MSVFYCDHHGRLENSDEVGCVDLGDEVVCEEGAGEDECTCTFYGINHCPPGAEYDPGGWRLPDPACPVHGAEDAKGGG